MPNSSHPGPGGGILLPGFALQVFWENARATRGDQQRILPMKLTFNRRARFGASSTILGGFLFVLGLLSIGWIFAQTEWQPPPPAARNPEPPAAVPGAPAPSGRERSPRNPAPAQPSTSSQSDAVLRNFLTHAYYHGKAELYLAQMASTRAVSPEVKQFAATVIADHGRVERDLFALAKEKGIKIDREYRVEQNPMYASMLSGLSQLSGPDFDVAYLEQTAENHTLELSQYLSLAGAASDSDTQLFAAQQVSRVRDRLRRAEQILRRSEHQFTAHLREEHLHSHFRV